MRKLKLGDRVKFPYGWWATRQEGNIKICNYSKGHLTKYPQEGIVVGVRLKWGTVKVYNSDDWARSNPIRTYLIATDLRGFHQVPAELVEKVGEGE